jgi:hypothetical protein
MKIIDPPSGWRYGFPKPIPDDVTDVCSWLVKEGYPKKIIDELGDHFFCRYWDAPEDEVATNSSQLVTDNHAFNSKTDNI